LAVLEQNKGLIDPKTYQRIVDNFERIPDETKERILVQLQNAAHLKKVIDEYDSQRTEALKDAFRRLRTAEKTYEKQYYGIMKKIEAEEKGKDTDNAESALKQI
jgi:DNA-binding SARP family transcriptional activator